MSVTDRAMGMALRGLGKAAGSDMLDRLGIRNGTQRALHRATRDGFRAAGAGARTFAKVRGRGAPARSAIAGNAGLFDLTPDDEQQMIADACLELAENVFAPAAAQADAARACPVEPLEQAGQLGLTGLGVPEELGGPMSQRSAVTGALAAEALARGDMGLALAALAPGGVATALALWGDADQQATYLPAFLASEIPAAAIALAENDPLADPLAPAASALRTQDGFLLTGCKVLVPNAADCELLIVSAQLDEPREPRLFIVPTSAPGIEVREEPAMGLHSAALGTFRFDTVKLPASALLGNGDALVSCVRRARLGWCALAAGTARAALDYVIPYVNERIAFGEPVSHRQAVAFAIADMAIELEGLRLALLRAAARADADRDFARDVAIARSLTERHGMAIGSEAVQMLGGHGYVTDHPVERYYRDLRAAGVMEGGLML